MKSRLWPLLFVVVASLVFGSVSLIYPHGRDQGIHAFIADSALSGKVVYRDVFNIKPPLTTFVHALSLLLFGRTMTAIRLLDLFWTLATALLLYLLVRRLFDEPWLGALAGVLYPLIYYPLGFWYTAQTDGWLNLPLLAALLLVAQDASGVKRWPSWVIAGVLIGLATLLKYTAVALLPFVALVLLYGQRKHIAGGIRACLWVTTGFVLTLAIAAIWLAVSGAMPAFIESQFGLVPAYARLSPGVGLWGRFVALVGKMVEEPVLCLPVLLAATGFVVASASYFLLKPWRAGLGVLGVLLVTGFASTFSQGKFFVYHYLPMFPALAALGALGLFVLLRPLARLRLLAASAALAALFVLALLAGYGNLFSNL
ncbi:MAG: glycosyltransferase family 39 protein, partial [candidate division WOR-3 bacterium]